jgi:predicted HD phosphohydrolase
MLSFLKRKASGAEIGLGFYDHLRKSYADGFPKARHLLRAATAIDSNAVCDEWLYLQIFADDLSVYLALGKTPAKAAVLEPFWQHIETWLQAEHVAALPERFAVAGGGPRFIPAEPSEPSYSRLLRRVQEYSSAVTSPREMGPNYAVAEVFASTCGFMEISSIIEVSAYFSSFKIQTVQFIKQFRIVA